MTGTQLHPYSQTEEILHAASHGAGAILSVLALVWMLDISVSMADPWRIVASSVYGGSLISLFISSTVYHTLHASPRKYLYKLVDHCAIYLLIAGTATPFLLVAMQTDIRWWLLVAIWTLAVAGILAKVWLRHRYPRLSLISYLLMGWMMVIALPQLIDAMGAGGIAWLVAGGVSYTVGAIFYVAKRLYFHHVIWHCFVLIGATCHFLAVLWYVLPLPG
jgi:hemolysin III